MGSVDSNLGYLIGRAFVDVTFKEDSKEAADTMVEAIRAAFKSNLPNIDWMDDATAQLAREKADAVIQRIGYPEWIKDDDALTKYYSDLPVEKATVRHCEILCVSHLVVRATFNTWLILCSVTPSEILRCSPRRTIVMSMFGRA